MTKDRIRIGRQPDNDLPFGPQKDASVSGYHAEIYRNGDAVFVQDLQSRNGRFVNGRKIDQPVLFKDGDVVQFSARGPKVSFLTGDASAEGKTAVFRTARAYAERCRTIKAAINGATVVLPSNALGSKPIEWVKDEAAQLRRRLDEMVHQLAIRFPVYLVISKCDLLAGFNEFFESLPESEKAQAMGFVNSDSVNAGASGFPQRAFRTICERAARLQVASLATSKSG